MTGSSNDQQVSTTRTIPADAQALFDVVADPSLHHVIDGSGSVKGVRGGSRKLALGDKFSTSMRIGVPYLISYLSRFMSLQPGDVISTGTPPGVGMGQNPPQFLKPGDRMELGIEGLGVQRQRVIADRAP